MFRSFVFWFGFFLLPFAVFGQKAAYTLRLDNDLFNLPNQTDRFYTSGLQMEAYHALFSKSPFCFLFIRGGKGKTVSGIRLEQNIYTPSNTRSPELLKSDRPYAATALLSQTQITANATRHCRITSSVGLGVLGKYSGGGFVQNGVHRLTTTSADAMGWEHQLKNDLLIDYHVGIEKGIVNSNYFQLNALGKLQAGTLKDAAELGASLSVGDFEAYFENALAISGNKPVTVRAFGEVFYQQLFYDATLQGGVINSASMYKIDARQMNHERLNYTVGVMLSCYGFQAKVGRTWQSAEFINMPSHAWGFIQIGWILH